MSSTDSSSGPYWDQWGRPLSLARCCHPYYCIQTFQATHCVEDISLFLAWCAVSSGAILIRIPAKEHRVFFPSIELLSVLVSFNFNSTSVFIGTTACVFLYTGCNRRNGPDFGRVFLRSNYTDITQNTYIQSSMVTEIMTGEVWNFDSCYSLIDYQIHIETGRNMWFL